MKLQKIILLLVSVSSLIYPQALFEIKDASDNTVFEIANDGLRVFNLGDTLMVISASEIKANISSSKDKALSRSFSVTTSTTGKGSGDVINIDSDGLRVYSDNDKLMDITGSNITAYIDSSSTKALSRSFSVTTSTTGKESVDVLEVSTGATKMREGDAGDRYTDFSPENIFLGLNTGIATEPGVPELYSGINNVFIGNDAGLINSSGYKNIFIGPESGKANVGGSYNIFIGMESGYLNSSGSSNAFVGNASGHSNTSGVSNVFIGANAGHSNATEDMNTYIGSSAGYSSTGAGNTFVGCISGYYSRTGYNNAFFGDNSGVYNDNGNYNSLYGSYSGHNNDGGSNNTIMGYAAGHGSNLSSAYNDNCLFGYYAGVSLQLGNNNVMMGSQAGRINQNGSGNVFLGYQSGYNETGSNKLYIDNSNTTTPLIYGDFGTNLLDFNTGQTHIKHATGTSNGLYIQNASYANNWHFYQYSTGGLFLYYNGSERGSWNITTGAYTSVSDKKFKKNIEDMVDILDKIMLIEPKRYNFISQKDNEQKYMGFIAQEVEKVFPSLAQYNDEDDTYTLDYAGFSVVAIQAIKEQQEEIDNLRSEIEEIKKLLSK